MLYFGGERMQGRATARYVYGFPLNRKNVICLWAFLWMLCFVLIGWFGDERLLCHGKWALKAERLLEKWQIPVLALELVLVLAMIIRICQNEAVDWDEAFTWQITTKNNVMGMLRATAADVHPPLYYLFVMGAMAIFGRNIFVAKMVSVAGAAATGILGITLVRKRWGVKTAIPFILVSGLGTQMIYYNVNLRMYSWTVFFVMAACLFAYEIAQSGKIGWWIAFTLVSLGGVYTQYYAVVPLALIYIGLLFCIIINDRGQIKKWLFCCLATVIGYLPWLAAVIDTLKRDAGDTRTEEAGQTIGELCSWAFGNNIELSQYMPAVLFLVAVLCVFLAWGKFEKKQKAFLAFSGAVFFGSYGLCMLIASYTQHFWANRYLVDVLLFVWLFLLIVLAGKSLLAWGMGMVWLGIMVLSSYSIVGNMELKTVPWTEQTKQLFAQIQDEEKIVYNFITFDVIYEYYLPNAEFIWYEDVDFAAMGDEFYMIDSPWGDRFSHVLYEEGVLEKELIGEFRMEEAVGGTLWKIKYKGTEEGEQEHGI